MLKPMSSKPRCQLLGGSSEKNIVITKVAAALIRAGLKEESHAFVMRAAKTDSYGGMIKAALDYVEVF